MVVVVNNKSYQMDDSKAKAIRNIAKEQVPRGVYALQKKGTLFLRNDQYPDKERMMQSIRKYNAKGFLAFWNWKDAPTV